MNTDGLQNKLVLFLFSACSLILSACTTTHTEYSIETESFSWILFVIIVILFIVLTFIFTIAIWKNHDDNRHHIVFESAEEQPSSQQIVVLGTVVPLAVIILMLGIGFYLPADASHSQNRETADFITIQVIGHQWWWEVRYPEHQVVTANEIQIPTGKPIHIFLTSDDVFHSFWLPDLNGKVDLQPGATNMMALRVDTVGEYTGVCAEYCGTQHAHMRFKLVAIAEDEFNQWIAHQAQPTLPPKGDNALVMEGYQAFMGSACVYCHTIRGTPANGVIGPDLTHFASRQTIGANSLQNNHGNLMGWVLNSQAIKPGNHMPPMYLDAEQVDGLIAYMQTLE